MTFLDFLWAGKQIIIGQKRIRLKDQGQIPPTDRLFHLHFGVAIELGMSVCALLLVAACAVWFSPNYTSNFEVHGWRLDFEVHLMFALLLHLCV